MSDWDGKFSFFSIWVFFHNHSRIIVMQGNEEGISLTSHYHFHLLHRQLCINRAINNKSSSLHMASDQARTRTLRFRAQVANR